MANFSNVPLPALNIKDARAEDNGMCGWAGVGAKRGSPSFQNGDSFDTTANSGGKDGLNFNGSVGVGPYSVVILSQ